MRRLDKYDLAFLKWDDIEEADCPKWVRRQLAHIGEPYLVHLTFDEGKYLFLQGRHYCYKITAGGQGGDPKSIKRALYCNVSAGR